MAYEIDTLPPDGRGAPPGARLPRTRDLADFVGQQLGQAASALGTAIQVERARRDLNQSDLGSRVGLSQLEVSAIERGKRQSLPAANVSRLLAETNLARRADVTAFALTWFGDQHRGPIPARRLEKD